MIEKRGTFKLGLQCREADNDISKSFYVSKFYHINTWHHNISESFEASSISKKVSKCTSGRQACCPPGRCRKYWSDFVILVWNEKSMIERKELTKTQITQELRLFLLENHFQAEKISERCCWDQSENTEAKVNNECYAGQHCGSLRLRQAENEGWWCYNSKFSDPGYFSDKLHSKVGYLLQLVQPFLKINHDLTFDTEFRYLMIKATTPALHSS